MTRAAEPGRGVLRRFFGDFVRPYTALQVEIGLCLLVGVALELADPLLLRLIIDRALGDGNGSLLALLVAVLGAVLLFRVAFRLLSVWLHGYAGLRILFDVRQRAFEHALRLSPYYYRGEREGDILARLTSDIDLLQRAAAQTIVNAAHDLLTVIGIASLLVWLDAPLALVLFAVYPLLALALAAINRRLRRESVRARTAIGDLYAFLEERIGAIRLIQEFVRGRREARAHVACSRPWIESNLALSVVGAGQVSLADVMGTGAFIVVLLLGGARVLDGTLSIGTLVAFYTFAQRLYRPISGLIDINIDLQMARASLTRIYELLDTEPDVREAPDAVAPARVAGAVRLERVTVAWRDGKRGLSEVDLEVPAGQCVAVVGPSGGGKSTLAALLARDLDPSEGTVSIDGLDLRRWTLRAIHDAVGLVPQETMLFHTSLAENLRFARRGATDAELREVLEAVELGPWLEGLPAGLDTPVGERGLMLSGGERQRLALARLLLKDPPIVVLDEATSALDPRTERRVIAELRRRFASRTLVMIAHRLTTVTDADRIVVVSGGAVVEQGPHEELYAARGLYQRLFDDQARPRATTTPPATTAVR